MTEKAQRLVGRMALAEAVVEMINALPEQSDRVLAALAADAGELANFFPEPSGLCRVEFAGIVLGRAYVEVSEP